MSQDIRNATGQISRGQLVICRRFSGSSDPFIGMVQGQWVDTVEATHIGEANLPGGFCSCIARRYKHCTYCCRTGPWLRDQLSETTLADILAATGIQGPPRGIGYDEDEGTTLETILGWYDILPGLEEKEEEALRAHLGCPLLSGRLFRGDKA